MTPEGEIIVRIDHVRVAIHPGGSRGLCMKGSRAWFAEHKLDWSEFVSKGMTVEKLRSTGCSLCERVIEVAIAEQRNGE